jgi:hypothetical protein
MIIPKAVEIIKTKNTTNMDNVSSNPVTADTTLCTLWKKSIATENQHELAQTCRKTYQNIADDAHCCAFRSHPATTSHA